MVTKEEHCCERKMERRQSEEKKKAIISKEGFKNKTKIKLLKERKIGNK